MFSILYIYIYCCVGNLVQNLRKSLGNLLSASLPLGKNNPAENYNFTAVFFFFKKKQNLRNLLKNWTQKTNKNKITLQTWSEHLSNYWSIQRKCNLLSPGGFRGKRVFQNSTPSAWQSIYIHVAAPTARESWTIQHFFLQTQGSAILGGGFSLESLGLWVYTVTGPLQLIHMQSPFSVTRLQMNSYRCAGGTQAANYVVLYTGARKKNFSFLPHIINQHSHSVVQTKWRNHAVIFLSFQLRCKAPGNEPPCVWHRREPLLRPSNPTTGGSFQQ